MLNFRHVDLGFGKFFTGIARDIPNKKVFLGIFLNDERETRVGHDVDFSPEEHKNRHVFSMVFNNIESIENIEKQLGRCKKIFMEMQNQEEI